MVLTSHRRGLRVTAVMGCALASVLL
ncbi:MAG: hypothetical protein QOI68_5701, partial [Pseudonocardiales bacterium]|nr:hypothetical protein [Pseudonocardiales bacterium]